MEKGLLRWFGRNSKVEDTKNDDYIACVLFEGGLKGLQNRRASMKRVMKVGEVVTGGGSLLRIAI